MCYGPYLSLRISSLFTRGTNVEDIDIHIAQRLRRRRKLRGMSQQELGQRVGVGFQQIQKYETGVNRTSAGMLWNLAAALEVPVGYFYEGYGNKDCERKEISSSVLHEPELMRLIQGYRQLGENCRLRIVELVESLT